MDTLLLRLSDTVASARTLEELTRPLLELLEAVTGFEATYLTTIDEERGLQRILYARSSTELPIPEGLSVPWSDTLCKRALDEGCMVADDVAQRWGDSDAARQLGIAAYASAPVLLGGTQLYGTLCAASSRQRPLGADAQSMLQLFSRLIAQQIERERLVQRLATANIELAAAASTDFLTGLPNRRVLVAELQRLLARGSREGTCVLVGLVDLDGFKGINDTHGHHAGDAFLVTVAARLQSALRATDLLARVGGDEFVVVGPGPAPGDAASAAAHVLAQRLTQSTVGLHAAGTVQIDYGGASVGVVAVAPDDADADAALKRADAAMYEVKRARRADRR